MYVYTHAHKDFRPQFRYPNPICFSLCVVFIFVAVVVVAIAVAPAFSHFMHSIFHKHTCTGQQKRNNAASVATTERTKQKAS